jgi:hypothetical protein
MNSVLFRVAVILALLLGMAAQAKTPASAPATGIHILVYGIHYGGNLVYHYKVVNNSNMTFNNFTIGSELLQPDGVSIFEAGDFPQLFRLPLGWKYGEKGEIGTEIILDPGSTSQPPNWKPWVFGQQETVQYYLEWHTPWGEGVNDSGIYPGQTLDGFTVTIPQKDINLTLPVVTGKPPFLGPDEMYVKGGFKVVPVSGNDVRGTLERMDTTPPTITVTLTPAILWPPNEKMIPVTAKITVKDDYDPQPEIHLESITANEALDDDDVKGIQPDYDEHLRPTGAENLHFQLKAERNGKNKGKNKEGRVYTITYSATDGSGNRALASATVTVPQDKEDGDKRGKEEGRNKK